MKLFTSINMRHKMIFTHLGFYISTALMVILCFVSGIYRDNKNDNMYSVISSLSEFNYSFMLDNIDFCSIMITLNNSNNWLPMFIPIISSFAFIPLICDEMESGFIRFSVFRSSKLSYQASKFLTACISGGLAVMLGYIIFTIFVYFLFPNINEYTPEMQKMIKDELNYSYPSFFNHGYVALYIIKFIVFFIYGILASVPSITLTCIIRNKYLVMSIPFFLKYAITQASIRLTSIAFNNFTNPNEGLVKFATVISPDSILDMFSSTIIRQILFYNAFLTLIAFALYMIICMRRLDVGE